jgi:hypothetical protein
MAQKKASKGQRRPVQRRKYCIQCKHSETEDLWIISICRHLICTDCLDNLKETVEDDEVVRSSVKRVLFYHTQLLRLFRLSLVLDANRLSTPTISKNAKLIA